jgi:hypothetical protein
MILEEDLIFRGLSFMNYKVSDKEIADFKKRAFAKNLPNEYIFETYFGYFKINKKEKTFDILKRKYYNDFELFGYPSDEEIDYATMIIYKVAIRSGFKGYLDNKYSN